MGIGRITKHLVEHHWRARRVFTPKALAAIEAAIKAAVLETPHGFALAL